MSEEFFIQASKPRSEPLCSDLASGSIDDLIEVAFSSNTEYFFIVWKHSWYRCSYKYTLSCMACDLISLKTLMDRNLVGSTTISWVAQEFPLKWQFEWREDSLIISSTPAIKNVVEGPLNEFSQIQMTVDSFWSEWKLVFVNCVMCIRDSFIGNSQRVDEIVRLVESIKECGRLYKG